MSKFTSFILIFFYTLNANAYDPFYSQRKQIAKDAKRWSLSEWLSQKEKIKLMDSWLMFNPPSPYEFYLSLDTSSFESGQHPAGQNPASFSTQRGYGASFGAFVTAVGLHGEYDESDETLKQWRALFMLRLLGSSDQSTNLTLHYGLLGQDWNGDRTQFQIAGARTSFYLMKAFALNAQYDHYFAATSETGTQADGSKKMGGAHIEYGSLRIYGFWFEEQLNLTLTNSSLEKRQRHGFQYGIKFYF